MEILTRQLSLRTQGNSHVYNITDEVQDVLRKEGFKEGQVCIFGIGSTTGISTVEFEPGLVGEDIREIYQKLIPYGVSYAHNRTWGDDNGASHLRSLLTGTSLNVPFAEGRLLLGTWQQIIFLDFDTRARQREIVVQILGVRSQ